MANFILRVSVFRVALPILLTLSIIFRPCVLSGIYLLFLLYLPLVPVPSVKHMKGISGIYLKILISFCCLITISQIAFQIVLFSMPPYAHFLENCSNLEQILRTVGYVRMNNMDVASVFTWITPEVIMTIGSMVIYIACKKLTTEDPESVEESPRLAKLNFKAFKICISIGKYVTLAFLCIAAILRPSVQGGLYFVVFLSACTWWACYKELRRAFAIVLRCVMVVVVLHIIALFVYQMQWPQELVSPDNMYARYFGLTALIQVKCSDPRDFIWAHAEWASYVNPLALIILHFMLAVESKHLLRTQVTPESDTSETTPLISGVSPSKKYGSGKKAPTILQDSTGSVTVVEEMQDDIPMETLGKGTSEDEEEEEEKTTWLDNVFYVVESLVQIIIRSAYIVTNVMMMTWSITFHSWVTFVLLLWANFLWMVPNQRRSMFRCSPFIVLYAWFLLIFGYIFSMNLNDDELPSSVGGVDLGLIGFVKVKDLPCKDLLIKCLFTVTFWITMRQYMQERLELRQNNALADMVAPLQVTVDAAAGVPTEKEKGNKTMKILGQYVTHFLTKFWIWVVAITLFGVAITGTRMTCFRIIYMALFLTFILSFQLSFRIWRKMMLGFWITVILYSMIVLILTYTYQFPNIREYWSTYLHVSKTLQLDIGLEDFGTKLLFIRLVTPTFFVIITAIQLHYFHKAFMALSDPKSVTEPFSEGSSAQGGILEPTSEKTDIESSLKYDITDLGNISTAQVQESLQRFLRRAHHASNLFFTFMEIHLPKLVLCLAMLLCVYDRCAIYLPVIILLVFSFIFGRPVYLFSIYSCSFLASLMVLARMIYQIEYFKHETWNANCTTETNETVVLNDAEWLGFKKTSGQESLSSLVKWNLMFVLAVTIWAVVLVRQFNYRIGRGKSIKRAYFMFPKITRVDADKNVKNCLKYLLNYGFYKFGVEICMLTTVALIGIRMDMYAMFYAVWLLILYLCNRTVLSRIWVFYLAFIAFVLPVQYIMLIGLPPSLCIEFPWEKSEMLKNLQNWAYLMSSKYNLPHEKLICDFVVLVVVARQNLVFRIESRHVNQEYPGGSNESIIHFAEDNNFVNPVPDYITFCRSYLDVMKRAVFLSFMWISLAIVFLAGTNRVNVFSIGYLLGSFFFLWQGSDIYLRPIPKILQSWDCLVGFNVIVILIKTALQLAGCVYIKSLQENACWFVHLFAVGCIEKFDNSDNMSTSIDPDDPIKCVVPRAYIGLAWDGICFSFLLLQRRIFNSYYFFHMVNESKAATILASRGADLIEELTQKRLREQEEDERRVLEKIKAKMERIKANQIKIQGPNIRDTTNHYVAIRSGDYYMFDDLEDEDEELDLIQESRSALEDEDEQEFSEKPSMGEFLSATMKTDIKTSVKNRESLEKRRSSSPIIRQRSILSGRSQISVPYSAPPAVGRQPHSVVIVDPKDLKKDTDVVDKPKEPQPSTSKDEDEEMSDLSEPKEDTLCQKILQYILFVWVFIQSVMVSLILFLNKYSREYRYILRVLNKEKKILKEQTTYNIGLRLGRSQVWQPAGSYNTLIRDARVHHENSDEKLPISEAGVYDGHHSGSSARYSPDDSSRQPSPVQFIDEYEAAEMSSVDQPLIIRLGLAIWYIILSHSDILCYFVIFLNQIKSATFLSLPLPMMVFLWGTLTIPRPSKTFWVIIIAYTETIVLIKCIFQFEILPWNRSQVISPFYPPRIIGVEARPYYAFWDLLVLLIVFFHRFLLKCLGLWKSTYVPAAAVVDGEYAITTTALEKIEQDPTSLSSALSTSATGAAQSSPKTNSEMQKLMEESETTEAKDTMGSISSDDKIVSIQTEKIDPNSNVLLTWRLACAKYASSFKASFGELMDPASRISIDVYTYMFICDFFNFFVLLIGYSAFGGPQQGDEGVESYLEDNRVPVLFLLMLILQFALIVIDRAIYLRKYIFGKIVFQFLQIIMLHIWLFILYPVITDRGFNSVIPPQMYYIVKCFYLLLSAFQIRCGYPTRILGNFICKGFNYVNMFLFKAFMAIPFLFELRTVMDWMWTDTSMTIMDWVKMEDIFAHIFQLKCARYVENEFPQARGEKKKPISKYLVGGGALIVMIAIIWFPLVFFSLGNAVGQANVPYDVTIDLRIGPYEPIYQMSVQANSIFPFKSADLTTLLKTYDQNRGALTFINNYEAADIAAVKFSTDSAAIWTISPPDRVRMVDEINSTSNLNIRLQYIVSHKSNTKEDSGIIREDVELVLPPVVNGQVNPIRVQLLEMLNGTNSNKVDPVPLSYLFPKFIKVTNRGTAKAVSQLMSEVVGPKDKSLRNITINRQSQFPASVDEWWEMNEDCTDVNYKTYLKFLPYFDQCKSLILYTFNDKIFPSQLNFITGSGIIGVYTTIVLVAGRLLRGFFAGMCFKIMFEDMPNVDRVLQLCYDVYLVREAHEYGLEEDLFAKLIFLFRSPETLIKWTRPKNEDEEEEEEEDDDDDDNRNK